jgi:hypothetical protein
MSSNTIMKTATYLRLTNIRRFEGIQDELFDVQPPQFNNTIRWNLGHLIAITDKLVFQRMSQDSKLPGSFIDLFDTGTMPAIWRTKPPSKDELIELLKKQFNDMNDILISRADEKLDNPLQIRETRFETIGEIIGFALTHEALHASNALCLVKVINYGVY